MTDAMLLALNVSLGLVVVVCAIAAMNEMGRHSHHGLRFAYFVTFLGALAVIVGPFYGYVRPPWAEVFFNLGFALVLAFDRRRASNCPRPPSCPLRG